MWLKRAFLAKLLQDLTGVKQVLDKVKTEGLMEAWRQSKARLEMPVPLGYSCAGIISEVNNADEDFHLGDRVACSGSGYASHAEYNVIPSNLCVKIPRRKLNVISYKLHEEGRQEIVNRYTLYGKDQERITDNE